VPLKSLYFSFIIILGDFGDINLVGFPAFTDFIYSLASENGCFGMIG
jgi:hypothetical protein